MKNNYKTNKQLLNEIDHLRVKIAELEKSESNRLFVEQTSIRVKNELRETNEYLTNLLNYANAPIIVWNPESRITRFNHAFEHLTGYKTDEVVGKELDILFPQASRENSLNEIKRTLGGEYWKSIEIPILREDGDERIVLWNSANIHAEDGTTLLATIAQGQDITERKQAEEKLISRNKELELYNEVTVNRELKMIKLKKEINELLKKSGEKPKYKIPI